MGHGLTALAVGGSFSSLGVFAGGSGLAYTATSHPWQSGLTSMGGLLAPPILGAILLSISKGPRRAQILLTGLAIAIIVSLAIWVRSVAGLIALPLVAALIIAMVHPRMRWGTPERRMVFVHVIGVILSIDTVSRSDYLFTSEVMVDGEMRKSDISNVATAFGGHYLLWGLLLATISFAFLALGLFMAFRKQKPKEKQKLPKKRTE
jgi:hypothetical protein